MKTQFDTLLFSTQALAAMVGGTIVRPGQCQHSGLVTDSRLAVRGCIFLALRGERTDGHNFIASAAANGATCIIAEQIAEEAMRTLPTDCAVILVPNTLYALGAMSKWYKQTIHPRVVAVTGSVGKTTTKQMVHAVLAKSFAAMRTEGNYNNEIGLPLTLMQLKPTDTIAVLEAGMSYAGELSRLSHICEPDVSIITNIGTSHIENLGSREGIRDAKLEILEGMQPGGTVILSGDEPLLVEKRDWITAKGLTPIYFAKDNKNADYCMENIVITSTDGTFDLRCTHTGAVTAALHIPVTGIHNIGNAAAAYLCGKQFGMTDDAIRAGLHAFENTGMRQKIIDIKGYTIIEDCYNASPESMEAALRVLIDTARAHGGRAIAVLGDMRELGSFAPSLHKRVGSFAADMGISTLFTFGAEAEDIAAGAIINGMDTASVFRFPDLDRPETIAETLHTMLLPGDTILFKASRAVEMERVAAQLLENIQ